MMKRSQLCELEACAKPAVAGGGCSREHVDILISQDYEKARRLGRQAQGLAVLAIALAVLSMVLNTVGG